MQVQVVLEAVVVKTTLLVVLQLLDKVLLAEQLNFKKVAAAVVEQELLQRPQQLKLAQTAAKEFILIQTQHG
jgi:hypothetical protein